MKDAQVPPPTINICGFSKAFGDNIYIDLAGPLSFKAEVDGKSHLTKKITAWVGMACFQEN